MRTELKNAFQSLGVSVGASNSEIRAAYRSLVRAHHRAHGAMTSQDATERLAEINAAKDLLDRHTTTSAPSRPRRKSEPTPQADATRPVPSETCEVRNHREAEARALRKSNEARVDTSSVIARYTRSSANSSVFANQYMRNGAEVDAREEEARRRRAAFAAANGAGTVRRTLLERLKLPVVR